RRHTRFSRDWSSDVCSSDLGWVAPHENETISLQFLWLESFDSPLAPSIFMNMSTATSFSLSCGHGTTCPEKNAHQPSFFLSDGSLDTRRSDTVSPSSW